MVCLPLLAIKFWAKSLASGVKANTFLDFFPASLFEAAIASLIKRSISLSIAIAFRCFSLISCEDFGFMIVGDLDRFRSRYQRVQEVHLPAARAHRHWHRAYAHEDWRGLPRRGGFRQGHDREAEEGEEEA